MSPIILVLCSSGSSGMPLEVEGHTPNSTGHLPLKAYQHQSQPSTSQQPRSSHSFHHNTQSGRLNGGDGIVKAFRFLFGIQQGLAEEDDGQNKQAGSTDSCTNYHPYLILGICLGGRGKGCASIQAILRVAHLHYLQPIQNSIRLVPFLNKWPNTHTDLVSRTVPESLFSKKPSSGTQVRPSVSLAVRPPIFTLAAVSKASEVRPVKPPD
ncbi:LOW QUALITY PROTEIN: hypothetical protein Cgig2_003993 [Carnegiea gigantea]|uniref:Uncharacterized protein n=1 Tax=Carnegiea gigantea TaxID=171969 RepID=A0A9Q1KAZ7_9CARY|nr:LOW QUALITY PROTEIN: hypothetical protein Cgig2_003993 [Carnegiea gigantea]